MRSLEKETAKHQRTAWICLSYGGRDELEAASKKSSGFFGFRKKNLGDSLWSAEMPDLDLVIRTGGDKRISNFLLWKIAYAELYFTDVLWPDFNEKELQKALDVFGETKRNFGA